MSLKEKRLNYDNIDEFQLRLLTKLTGVGNGLTFSELKPNKLIDNDIYNYHLKYLIKNGLVEKNDKIYTLTKEGVSFIANINSSGEIQNMFRVSVALDVFRINPDNGKREMLMQKRLRHPFYGNITNVSGKVQKGETIEKSAQRKLHEETGLKANFILVGVQRKIRRDNKKNILEDVFFHHCYAKEPTGSLIKENHFGINFWLPIKEAIKYKTIHNTKDQEIVKRLSKGNLKFFYYQDDYIVESY